MCYYKLSNINFSISHDETVERKAIYIFQNALKLTDANAYMKKNFMGVMPGAPNSKDTKKLNL